MTVLLVLLLSHSCTSAQIWGSTILTRADTGGFLTDCKMFTTFQHAGSYSKVAADVQINYLFFNVISLSQKFGCFPPREGPQEAPSLQVQVEAYPEYYASFIRRICGRQVFLIPS